MTECKHEVLTKVGRWKQKRKCCSCGAVLTLRELGLNPKAIAHDDYLNEQREAQQELKVWKRKFIY